MRRLSDRLNMCLDRVSSNEGTDMSAMRLAQGRSASLTQKKTFWMKIPQRPHNNKALLEGRAGPKFERGRASRKRDMDRRGGREVPVNVARGYRSDPLVGSTRGAGMTAMRAAHVVRMLAVRGDRQA